LLSYIPACMLYDRALENKAFAALGHLKYLSLGFPREYWMIHRGPGFLAVVWFGSSPSPPPSSVSKFSIVLSLPVGLTDGEEGGKGVGRSQIIRWRESLVLYRSSNTLWVSPKFTTIILT
jgi:hypothetical protein